jgi:hypothetical protein
LDKKNVEAHYKWNIKKGDYKLSRESTRTHSKKKARKKLIKTVLLIFGYLTAVVLIALWYFS